MEEQMPQTKMNKKAILPIVLIIIALAVIALEYNQIIGFLSASTGLNPSKEELTQANCQQLFKEWCNSCFSINGQSTGSWDIGGTKIGETVAKCSNNFFQTDWTAEQDCTGNTRNYCLPQIDVSIE